MPIYLYEVILEDDEPGHRFEVFQKMSDPPLTHHPKTGQPVRRLICAPKVAGRNSDMAVKSKLKDDRAIEQMGFTKYQKTGDGRYEKTAGKGPDLLKPDE